MPTSMCFLENINFTKNLENYLQLVGTKEFKHWIGNLAIYDSNPVTLCSMKPSEKLKGIFKALICFVILKTPS